MCCCCCRETMRPSSTTQVLHEQERTRGRAQGPRTQRHVTTTACCRSRNWPVVRATVGVSEVVRTAVDRRKTTWHRSGGRLASRPRNFLFFSFSWPRAPLLKDCPACSGITSCCGTISEGISKILVGIRPVLHAIWSNECLRIGIVAKQCDHLWRKRHC